MLRTERDSVERMQLMRLVKIQKQYDGEYQIAKDILPPCLNVNATSAIREVVQGSADMISNLVREFAKNRLKIGDISSYSSTEMTDFLFQKELAILLPEFQQFVQQTTLHPYGFYQLISKMHQIVSVYVHPESIGKVTEYKHDSLEECLLPIINDVRPMLALRKDRPEDQVKLNVLSPGRYETTEIPRHALENFSFYLAVDCKQDSVEWVNQFVNLCKLASVDQLDAIVSSGLPGVQMKHVQRLPQKIRIKSGYEYFQVSTDSELWNSVLLSQKFGVFCMGQFAEANIELIMLEEK
jgi:type VI secretion system protein ImpJ